MHSNHFFSSYWVAVWSNSIIFFFLFFLFFCHYFMYHNNNLHQKLAVSEILNNVSLSLSLSLSLSSGDPIATSCVFPILFFGRMHYVYLWVKEEKHSIQNRNFLFFLFFYILNSSTLFHRSQNNLFHSIV